MKENGSMERIEVSNLDFIRIEPRGKGTFEKFWVNHDGYKKLVKINGSDSDQDVMEKISSVILKQLGVDAVDVDLGYDECSKSNCCLVTSFLTDEADTSYDTYNCIVIRRDNQLEELRLCFEQIFSLYASLALISSTNLEQLKIDFIRTIFGKCLIDNLDAKLENIGLIFNEKNNNYRIPPSYDNGLAFSSYKSVSIPHCCVGNQYFEIPLIIDFLLENYLDNIKDIVDNLDDVINSLDRLISKYMLDNSKKQYVIEYMSEINKKIKQKLNKERKL